MTSPHFTFRDCGRQNISEKEEDIIALLKGGSVVEKVELKKLVCQDLVRARLKVAAAG